MCRFTREAQQLNLNLLRRRQIQSLSNVIKSCVFLYSLKGHTQSSLVGWKSFNKAAVLINPELHQSWVRKFDSEDKGLILFLLRVSSCFMCFSNNIHMWKLKHHLSLYGYWQLKAICEASGEVVVIAKHEEEWASVPQEWNNLLQINGNHGLLQYKT